MMRILLAAAAGRVALIAGCASPVPRPGATYTSIRRLEAPGVRRMVFDKDNDACDCAE